MSGMWLTVVLALVFCGARAVMVDVSNIVEVDSRLYQLLEPEMEDHGPVGGGLRVKGAWGARLHGPAKLTVEDGKYELHYSLKTGPITMDGPPGPPYNMSSPWRLTAKAATAARYLGYLPLPAGKCAVRNAPFLWQTMESPQLASPVDAAPTDGSDFAQRLLQVLNTPPHGGSLTELDQASCKLFTTPFTSVLV